MNKEDDFINQLAFDLLSRYRGAMQFYLLDNLTNFVIKACENYSAIACEDIEKEFEQKLEDMQEDVDHFEGECNELAMLLDEKDELIDDLQEKLKELEAK